MMMGSQSRGIWLKAYFRSFDTIKASTFFVNAILKCLLHVDLVKLLSFEIIM